MRLTHLTTNKFLQGETSPLNRVTPEFVGQTYITSSGSIFIATNLGKEDWVNIPLIDLENDIGELKSIKTKVETNTTDIANLKILVDNSQGISISDIHNVMSQSFDLKNYYPKKEVDGLLLKYEAICNDLTRKVVALGKTDKLPCVQLSVNGKLEFTDLLPKILTVNPSPVETTDTILYTSSDPSVATVDRGLVTPLRNGSTTITVQCGKGSAKCEVVVNIPVQEAEAGELLDTSNELRGVNGNITVPFISNLPSNYNPKYLVWDLYHEGEILGIGIYKESSLVTKIVFDCSHLATKTYEGVKMRVKRYNPVKGDFEILAVSNDITVII